MKDFGFSLAELEVLADDNTQAVLWLSAVRALNARKRLERQEDISAGVMPRSFKLLKTHLTNLAYGDADEDVYRQMIYAINDIPAGPLET